MKRQDEELLFVVAVDGTTGKALVEHRENGILIDDIDSVMAAKAIAVLANMGHLFRDDSGSLCIDSSSQQGDVITMEEFMDAMEDLANDDGPEENTSDETRDADAYGPLESTQG